MSRVRATKSRNRMGNRNPTRRLGWRPGSASMQDIAGHFAMMGWRTSRRPNRRPNRKANG